MGQALYRKHRPKSLQEVVGQEHITGTLTQALKQGRISHAYLFTGPRGVGKTSIARIWAHEINGLPYTDNSNHIDIIEIDAASNRRIDEIRELRDKVYVAPTSAKYKVYIIDEVHMLTKEAFNALLKTLEEPPAHVVFILATTDAHKLPDTIISRTQRFSFKPGEQSTVVANLQQIAKLENIKISEDALALLATHGGGSFRDSISLLDQVSSQSDTTTLTDVQQLLGIPPADALGQLYQLAQGTGNSAALMQSLAALYDQGYQAAMIAKQLGLIIRAAIIHNKAAGDEQLLQLLEQLIEVPIAHDPERYLEIILLRAQPKTKSMTAASQPSAHPVAATTEPPEPPELKSAEAAPTSPIEPSSTTAKPKNATAVLDETIWPAVLQTLKQRHNTLYGVVRMAQPDFSLSGELTLAFAFSFHQKRITENSNQQKLADIIEELTGQVVRIGCRLDKTATPPQNPIIDVVPVIDSDLTAISNIFGDAELLES